MKCSCYRPALGPEASQARACDNASLDAPISKKGAGLRTPGCSLNSLPNRREFSIHLLLGSLVFIIQLDYGMLSIAWLAYRLGLLSETSY